MKWTQRRNELDAYYQMLKKDQKLSVYIFGYGQLGKKMVKTLQRYNMFSGVIDNDLSKHGLLVYGKEIISFEAFESLEKEDNFYIVITATEKNQKMIAKQLKERCFIHGKHYFFYQEFNERILPIIATYQFKESYIPLAQICLTERCTLKCKKCAHACYAVDNNAEDMTLLDVFKSADLFFSKVDYIEEFVLIGGEPLLFKQLKEVIEYIGSSYRKQMNIFCITTNGTIIPSKAVLEQCRKYHVLFRISNYTNELPHLKNHYERLIEVLERYEIQYILGKPENEWMDYGFDYVNRDCSEEELIKIFSSCNTPCREVRGNKYYYCVMARSVADNLGYNIGKNDYLDLNQLTGDDYKKELLEFNLGYSEKGYLDMCKHCHGKEAKNYLIPAAQQIEN